MPKSYPLDWPVDLPRCEDRRPGRFNSTMDKSLEELRHELKLLGASHILVSCNLPVARDGWPDPRARLKGGDPAVAVYWLMNGKSYVIGCDQWDLVQDNLRAITLTIQADRGKTRWGCAQIAARSMAGYASLPAPERWFDLLGVPEEAPLDEIEAIYRLRVKQIHPDRAKDDAERSKMNHLMAKMNEAISIARKVKSHVAEK